MIDQCAVRHVSTCHLIFCWFITIALKDSAGSIYFRRHPVDWMHHTLSDTTHSSAAWTGELRSKGTATGVGAVRDERGNMCGICFVCTAWIWTRVSFKYLYLKLLYTTHRQFAQASYLLYMYVHIYRSSI